MKRKTALITERVKRYCQVHLRLLDGKQFKLGELNYTYKCHFNAVQKAVENPKLRVFLVMTLDGEDYPIVHFINYDGKKYIDNTWGYQYSWSKYYFIKEISREEFQDVTNILDSTKRQIIRECMSPLERFIFRIGDNEI